MTAPIRCRRCGSDEGPFAWNDVLRGYVCGEGPCADSSAVTEELSA